MDNPGLTGFGIPGRSQCEPGTQGFKRNALRSPGFRIALRASGMTEFFVVAFRVSFNSARAIS